MKLLVILEWGVVFVVQLVVVFMAELSVFLLKNIGNILIRCSRSTSTDGTSKMKTYIHFPYNSYHSENNEYLTLKPRLGGEKQLK